MLKSLQQRFDVVAQGTVSSLHILAEKPHRAMAAAVTFAAGMAPIVGAGELTVPCLMMAGMCFASDPKEALETTKATLAEAQSYVTNPIIIFSAANLIGDYFYSQSGAEYNNFVRETTAYLGMTATVVGFGVFGKKFGSLSNGQVALGLAGLCGGGYMVSGSNIFNLEDTARWLEVAAGASLGTGAILNLLGFPEKGSWGFMGASAFFSFSVGEHYAKTDDIDWNVIAGSASFIVGNIATRYIKHNNEPNQAI